MINLPGFNDAAHNWETFESNTFFSLFTTNAQNTKYGFHLQLTCQKPILAKEMFYFEWGWVAFWKHLQTKLRFQKWYSHVSEGDLFASWSFAGMSLFEITPLRSWLLHFYSFPMWLDKHWNKTTTVSADECLFWNDIFEEWPKAEINEFGIRTMEFLPNFKPFNESSQIEMEWFSGHLGFPGVPYSIQNLTYITWQDNRFVY